MEIKARGWGRDMGTKTWATHDLSQFRISDDPYCYINWNSPGLFARFGEVTVAWGQDLKHQGSYRMDLTFSQRDIFKLFMASYGRELDLDLLEQGFTISEALKKRVLSEIKLADLTIGDLAKLSAGSAEPEPKQQQAEIKPFRRI
ncbi:hypothetical protein [Bradyrhizobium sp. DOA9]|uniref:hypothetical protein n=1 Tax=Bradyrhizobium sp. DOA9 TaxID=1126627 RepID=UPI0004680B51|nr:hypothetical protein [Bradyrhizobium sp. DOA9]GAJ36519.1 hypothetical protein BDOA9_0157360 [Bradyrhizobium sp. DOA9]